MIRLVVAGTRDASFEDIPVFIAAIRRWVSRNGRPTVIVCGGNNPDKTLGADLIGAHLALKAGVRIDYLPADWTRGGTVERDKSAGPERTAMMIKHANGLVVVRHKWSVGSAYAVEFAHRKWGRDAKEIEDVLIEKRVANVAR